MVETLERAPAAAPAPSESAPDVPPAMQQNVVLTSLNSLVNWARGNALWPFPLGTACCAIEFMAVGASRFDISRFGAEVVRFSPRQADVMLVAGTVTTKMAPVVRRIYDQMAEPKYVIAMGVCTISGGPFQGSYSTVPGIDNFVPVDVHVPGCPPRPDALLYGLMRLQEKVKRQQTIGGPKAPALKGERARRGAAAAGSGKRSE